jgi:hypothetical protein
MLILYESYRHNTEMNGDLQGYGSLTRQPTQSHIFLQWAIHSQIILDSPTGSIKPTAAYKTRACLFLVYNSRILSFITIGINSRT